MAGRPVSQTLTANPTLDQAHATARQAMERGQVQAAADICRKILDIFPDDTESAAMLGRISHRHRRPLSPGFCDREIYYDPLWNHVLADDPESLGDIQRVLASGNVAISFHEAVNIWRFVKRTNHIEGDIAELGTLFGRSAKIMAMANISRKKFHVFDTFSGIPEISAGIDTEVSVGSFSAPLESVKEYLRDYSDIVEYHVGIFPESAGDVPLDTVFSFVNLDFDTYSSTKSALEFFYPRMTRGGMVLCHDYFSKSCPGVHKAIDEFFADKRETLVDLWHTQIVAVKM
jgi:hypothetical protein